MHPEIEDDLLNFMRRYDTPTICNAIEVAQGKRGFSAYTKKSVMSSAPTEPAIVGFARTAKLAGTEPPTEPQEVIRKRRIEYFRSMAAGPRPAIAVVEDTDYPHCIAAWWGEVHSVVHKGLKMEGALTNGLMRDLGDLEPGFPILAGSVGPSHGYVHVREIGTPVNIFGLTINEGDLVHADRHGAIVVPPEIMPDLKPAIEKLLATEQLIIGPGRQPDFDLEKLEIAWAAFEEARV